jgi:Ni/Fe-hydrogenase subunit HybB-like protein
VYLFENTLPVGMFWIEFGLLTMLPFFLFLSPDVRRSPGWLFAAALMYICGIILNRSTVFFIAYQPVYGENAYIPAVGEFALTIGLIAALMLVYRVFVTLLPVLPLKEAENGEH